MIPRFIIKLKDKMSDSERHRNRNMRVIMNLLERLGQEEALLHVVVTDSGGVHISDS